MASNYYQQYPIHPHQRYHTQSTASNSAYTRNSSTSWQSNNKNPHSSSAPRLKNVRMVEPNTFLSDYRQGGHFQVQNQMNFAPIYQTQKYDGKAILERTQKRIQEAHRKRGNLVEGKMRPVAKEPMKIVRPKIQNIAKNISDTTKIYNNASSQKPIITPTISRPVSSKISQNSSKISLELPITSTKIAVKSAEPPSIRKNETKPQPNANNDWSTNYNDDFRNWQQFKNETKKPPGALEEFVTVGQTATHHLNAEKRKYMERVNREAKAKRAAAFAEKKQQQQDNIEKRRLDTQKVLDNLSNDSEKDGEKENKVKTSSATTIPFSTANTKFPSETTNTSTFKRWPKSAFQTVASRSAEKPIWAAPAGSQHFPVQQPRQKVLKDSTKHNMNITLTIDGKSMGSRSTPNFKKNQQQNVANTQNSNSGRNNKSKFQSEYSSKFKTPGQFV